jgi:hypothetical protein
MLQSSSSFFGEKREAKINSSENDAKSPNTYMARDWQNGVLILVPTRLGIKSIAKEYYEALV